MSKSALRHAALLMLVIFLTNMMAFALSATRLAHELDHDAKLELSTSDHVHDRLASNPGHSDDASDAVEHQVLHAIDHVQLFPDVGFTSPRAANGASIVRSHIADKVLPHPGADLPFRPPRARSLPA